MYRSSTFTSNIVKVLLMFLERAYSHTMVSWFTDISRKNTLSTHIINILLIFSEITPSQATMSRFLLIFLERSIIKPQYQGFY